MAEKNELANEVINLYENWYQYRLGSFEDTWIDCFYNYISEYDVGNNWLKNEGTGGRSKIFIGMTRRKVYAVYNKVCKAILSSEDYPYSLSQSPANDLPPNMQQKYDLAIVNMKRKIDDNLLRMRWQSKARLITLGALIFGSSIIKFPVVKRVKRSKYRFREEMPGMSAMGMPGMPPDVMSEPILDETYEIVPDMEFMNIFEVVFDPSADPTSEQPLQTGRGVIQTRYLSKADLQVLALNPSYNKSVIKSLLEYEETPRENIPHEDQIKLALGESNYEGKEGFKFYEMWGLNQVKHLKANGAEIPKSYESGDYIESMVSVAHNCKGGGSQVVKAVFNPFEPVRRPYFMLPYEKQVYSLYGRGLVKNIFGEQSALNSFVRAFMDNKALAATPPFVANRSLMPPGAANKSIKLESGKMFDSMGMPADKFIKVIEIPDISDRMLPAIDLMERYMDEDSGINRISMGMESKQLTDTMGGMAMLLEMASETVLGFMDNIDTYFTKPFIESLYHYLMQFDEDPTIKGDYEVRAGGAQELAKQQTYWQKILNLLNSVGGQLPPELITLLVKAMAKSMGVKEVYEYLENMSNAPAQPGMGGPASGTMGNSPPPRPSGMASPGGGNPPGNGGNQPPTAIPGLPPGAGLGQ